jgi:hypothetical protein
MKSKLPDLGKDLEDPNKFKEIYRFSFNFAKEPDQKILGTASDPFTAALREMSEALMRRDAHDPVCRSADGRRNAAAGHGR